MTAPQIKIFLTPDELRRVDIAASLNGKNKRQFAKEVLLAKVEEIIEEHRLFVPRVKGVTFPLLSSPIRTQPASPPVLGSKCKESTFRAKETPMTDRELLEMIAEEIGFTWEAGANLGNDGHYVNYVMSIKRGSLILSRQLEDGFFSESFELADPNLFGKLRSAIGGEVPVLHLQLQTLPSSMGADRLLKHRRRLVGPPCPDIMLEELPNDQS